LGISHHDDDDDDDDHHHHDSPNARTVMSLRSGVLFTINFMCITLIKFQTPDYGQSKNQILFNVIYHHQNFMEMKYLKCLLVLKVTSTNAADTSAGFVISNTGERC